MMECVFIETPMIYLIWFPICYLDMNECTLGNHRCHFKASCKNIIGSYTCTCNEGFTGNGTICKGMVVWCTGIVIYVPVTEYFVIFNIRRG